MALAGARHPLQQAPRQQTNHPRALRYHHLDPPPSTQASPIILDPKQDNCSALACHFFSHVKNLHFNTKAEVANWCRSNLEIKTIWRLNTISLLQSASTKNCRLCAVERMAIGRHFGSTNIINLKSELCGVCSCKTRFLWFARSG
jgi:hypothetical protein